MTQTSSASDMRDADGLRAMPAMGALRVALIALCGLAAPAFAQDQAKPADIALVGDCLDKARNQAAEAASAASAASVVSAPPAAAAGCIGLAATACVAQPGGDSTAGMVTCVQQEAAYWDGLLNSAYQDLVTQAKRMDAAEPGLTPSQIDLLRDMQRNWITFRDTSCQWEGELYRGGSIQGPIYANCMMQLTAEQALRLQAQRDLAP